MRLLPAKHRMAGIFFAGEAYLVERTKLLPATSLKIAEVMIAGVVAGAAEATGGQQRKL
jgi:hypothetical protein